MIAQANRYLRGLIVIFFIADDLFLNPRLNENNYIDELGIKKGDSLLRRIIFAIGRSLDG